MLQADDERDKSRRPVRRIRGGRAPSFAAVGASAMRRADARSADSSAVVARSAMAAEHVSPAERPWSTVTIYAEWLLLPLRGVRSATVALFA